MSKTRNILFALTFAAAATIVAPQATAQQTGSISQSERTFNSEEMIGKGHEFFGKTSRGVGRAVEMIFEKQGEPTAYIVGEEGSAAIVGGLRFGEGTIYYKDGSSSKIFWQGPSIGWDFGGNGSRTLVLVYNSNSPEDLYGRFGGVEGSAYLVGGLGVNFQKRKDVILAPIRSGVGARLGANIGYLKYSPTPTWNPF